MASPTTSPLNLPQIYLFEYRLSANEMARIIHEMGDSSIDHVRDADILLCNTNQWVKAEQLLRAILIDWRMGTKCLFPVTAVQQEGGVNKVSSSDHSQEKSRKRRKIDKMTKGKEVISLDSSTESETEKEGNDFQDSPAVDGHMYGIYKLQWYYDSLKAGQMLDLEKYLVYKGYEVPLPAEKLAQLKLPMSRSRKAGSRVSQGTPPRESDSGKKKQPYSSQKSQPLHLLSEITSDHEDSMNLPPLPPYLALKNKYRNYACCRPTPRITPNDAFLEQLRTIKEERELINDPNKYGQPPGLTYAHAIASIASYPYTITSSAALARLPHCGNSVLDHFHEFTEYGECKEVKRIRQDERTQMVKFFNGIYDVGFGTAREWYDKKGWRGFNDVVNNWESLSPNKQIGLKYLEDFTEHKIPRPEVERIGATVLEYARKVRPSTRWQMVITGGYRRGKPESGDVDVVLTHPDEDMTLDLIDDLIVSLSDDGWMINKLMRAEGNSKRGQEPLALKDRAPESDTRIGFCTLDKALIVWQDADLARHPKSGVENWKRRVDIIITPWKTAGCAIIGWSGGTTFERDLRRYCRKEKGYKFDSSGIRRLSDGEWMDFEKDGKTLEEKEKLTFEGLGLKWLGPESRCTG